MDYGSFIGPAVVAAVVSGVISVVGLLVNRSTTIMMHSEKLDADRCLAERKVEADITLARQKFNFDRDQAIFRRRFDLAEQLLADAYRFREMMGFVRNGVSWVGEGDSRKAGSPESEGVKSTRDSYFVPLKRLSDETEFLSALFARRTASQAHFGVEAEKAFGLFQDALHRTRMAASLLIEWTLDFEKADRETLEKLRSDIWQPLAKHKERDEIGAMIDDGVLIIEQLCHPVLQLTSVA